MINVSDNLIIKPIIVLNSQNLVPLNDRLVQGFETAFIEFFHHPDTLQFHYQYTNLKMQITSHYIKKSEFYKDPFRLLFYAAAFKSNALFHDHIRAFLKNLSKYHPFNILSDDGFFSLYTLFDPESNPAGPSATNIPNIGLTLDKPTGRIKINAKSLLDKIEVIKIKSISSERNLKQLVKGDNLYGHQCLLVVLMPPQGEGGFENEFANNGDDTFYFISTSCDGNWEQMVIRSMCKLMGLGDEFEQSDPDSDQPDESIGKMLNSFHPNLIYLDTPFSSIPSANTKWRMLANKIGFDFPIRRAQSHPTKADLSIPAHNFLPSNIELWEGGGGYRTQIYRSAHDCLMRRQIGNKKLPVRTSVVPLCPVCSAYMLQQILEFGQKTRVPSLEFRGFIQQL